jgi:hypothetical protein
MFPPKWVFRVDLKNGENSCENAEYLSQNEAIHVKMKNCTDRISVLPSLLLPCLHNTAFALPASPRPAST